MSAKQLIGIQSAVLIAVLAACSGMPKASNVAAVKKVAAEKNFPTPIYRTDCDMPSTDEDGDGKVTMKDQFIREYYQTLKGEPICIRDSRSRYIQRLLFDTDQIVLKPNVVEALQEAAGLMKQHPDIVVEVAGHADSVGTDRYNQQLSLRRARAAYDYLIRLGVEPSRLRGPIGRGERFPIAPNNNEDGSDNPRGRAYNRRIELNVQN